MVLVLLSYNRQILDQVPQSRKWLATAGISRFAHSGIFFLKKSYLKDSFIEFCYQTPKLQRKCNILNTEFVGISCEGLAARDIYSYIAECPMANWVVLRWL